MKREITDNIRNPVVMIIIAIILIAVLICSMVFTYAAASTPGGYSSETKSGRYGYKNGYFYVHFYKNNSCYKSVKISTEAQTEVTGATALYTELTRNASKYAVSSSDPEFIQITSTPVTSRTDPITGSVQEIYCFTRINSKGINTAVQLLIRTVIMISGLSDLISEIQMGHIHDLHAERMMLIRLSHQYGLLHCRDAAI